MDRLMKKIVEYQGLGSAKQAKATRVVIRFGLIMLIVIILSFLPSMGFALTINSLERTVLAGSQTYTNTLSGQWNQSASDTQYVQKEIGWEGDNPIMGTFTVYVDATQQSNVAFTGQTMSLQASHLAGYGVQAPPDGYGMMPIHESLGVHSSSKMRIEFTPYSAATYELNLLSMSQPGNSPNVLWLTLLDLTTNNYVHFLDSSLVLPIQGTLIAGHLYRLESMGSADAFVYPPSGGLDWYYTMALTEQATPVPVPPSVWLLGSGLVGLVGLRRRFRK